MAYILRENVYIDNESSEKLSYSDGDESENYILECINKAGDLSTGSPELTSCIRDWTSNYHLNPMRADLLRPLAEALQGKSILEIGSGCGAITRYLGELDCSVTAVEGSERRARITAQRCRDLSGIQVFCDNFRDFFTQDRFDVILLVGVLEYSNIFMPEESPVQEMLKKAGSLLKPGGKIVIAIENKLGLKYLAGAPEDHTGRPYFGIENRYTPSTPITFGKGELKEILVQAGFWQTRFWYPFPDYKLPKVILTEKGIEDDALQKEDLLLEKLEYIQDNTYMNLFSTSLALETFSHNKLLAEFSNSFLVMAENGAGQDGPAKDILAYTYNSIRSKPYCLQNSFVKNESGCILVKKSRLYPMATVPAGLNCVTHNIRDEHYYSGELLMRKAVSIISREGWRLEDLQQWCQLYYNILQSHSIRKDGVWQIPGKFIDLTPFNLIEGKKGIHSFDQEWVAAGDLPLYYVFFRGILYSLLNILFFNRPGPEVPHNLLELVISLINTVIPFNTSHLADCREKENNYFSYIQRGATMALNWGDIHIRGAYDLEKKLEEKEKEVDQVVDEMTKTRQELASTQSKMTGILGEMETLKMENACLQKNNDWYLRTYEQRGILGVLKEKLSHMLH